MLKAWKHYWAFTNSLYKLVLLFVVPILLIGVNIYFELYGEVGDCIFALSCLYYADTISDVYFMGGFYHKGNSALEFMQSSSKFSNVMKDVVMMDFVRRVLVYQIPLLIAVVGAENAGEIQWCKLNAFWSWLMVLIAQCVVVAARHYELWHHIYACVAVGYCAMMFIFLFIAIVSEALPIATNIVLVVLVVVVGIVTIRYTDKKVRDSYYDE